MVRVTRNLPTDLTGLADIIVKLKDTCSQETLLTLLPFIENPAGEIKKFKQEQASSVSQKVDGADEEDKTL